MKIALVNTFYYPDVVGGAEVVVQEQAAALLSRGYDVFVICLGKTESVRQEVVSGIKVYRIPYSNRYWIHDRFSRSAVDKVLWHLKDRYNRDIAGYLSGIVEEEKPQKVKKEQLSPEYIQRLFNRIAELEDSGESVNREELKLLNAELDAILEYLGK